MLIIRLILFVPLMLLMNKVDGHYLSTFCSKEKLGTFPYPGTCDVYFRCEYGNVTVYACDPGLAFDPIFTKCDVPKNVTSCNNFCFSNSFRRLPHPKHCENFFVCIDGVIHVKTCKCRGTVYKIESDCCDLRENVPGCSQKLGDALNLRGDLNVTLSSV